MADAAIVVDGLVKRFGSVTALTGVYLQVPAGTVLGLLGPNLTGRENPPMIARLSGLGRQAARQRAEELLNQFDLAKAAGRTVKS
jgi:ABC-type multidrug transport system ATPase subunit